MSTTSNIDLNKPNYVVSSQEISSPFMSTSPSSILTPPPDIGLTPKKLSRKEIYQKIDDIICNIQTSKGKATGFLFGKGLICAPFHLLDLEEVRKINENEREYKVNPIHFTYQGVSYEAEWHTPSMQVAHDFDCGIFKVKDNDFNTMSDLILFTDAVEPGEKVYFGGFPLTQDDPTFHSGVISSTSEKNGMSFFTIDGTVVPGNSGGPVFILQDNRLKLVGIISYQIADFSPEDQRTIAIMKALKAKKESSSQPSGFAQICGNTFDMNGLTTPIQITNPDGKVEEVKVNDRDTICLALDLIQRNLSTGIGKAWHIQHFISVCDGRKVSLQTNLNSNGVPVMKGERLPGMLSKDPVYRIWYHRQVKGQSLCVTIIGRQLGASDGISAQEEKALWAYYTSNPHYNGFQQLTLEDEFKKIKNKIISAKSKMLKNHKEDWKNNLLELKEKLPSSFIKDINQLLDILGFGHLKFFE